MKLRKLYYSIREVAEQTGVEPHVLRFWEKEFSVLRPKRGRSGNRSYREQDLRIVLAIKDLLYNHKYTIKGAQERLKEDRSLLEHPPAAQAEKAPGDTRALLAELRSSLIEIRELMGSPESRDPGTR
jgi:DNA-binding transcriptional MerR regulator